MKVKTKVLALFLCLVMLVTGMPSVYADGGEPAGDGGTRTVTVNFIYESSNTMAAQPYMATVPTGEAFDRQVSVPSIQNYSLTADCIASLLEGVSLDASEGVLVF